MSEHVSTSEAARILGLSPGTIIKKLKAGELDGYFETTNAGARTRQYKFSLESIKAYIAKRKPKSI